MNAYTNPEYSQLGKKTEYESIYNPSLLFPISRQRQRDHLEIGKERLPFFGFDLWNHYEVSWLNEKGKPVVALVELIYACDSLNIIESKSMKLYFNSFNNTPFRDADMVKATLIHDLSELLNSSYLDIRIHPLQSLQEVAIKPRFAGIYLDDLDIECAIYRTEPGFLITEDKLVCETVCSDLLKSNCLVTNQPDWCSVQISYEGRQINHEGLLKYLVSFRNDNEFHEHCIEKIFMHIMKRCYPTKLTVYGRSARRGGLDINAIRSTEPVVLDEICQVRLCRQ